MFSVPSLRIWGRERGQLRTVFCIEGHDRSLPPAVINCRPRRRETVSRLCNNPALLLLHVLCEDIVRLVLMVPQFRVVVDGLVDSPEPICSLVNSLRDLGEMVRIVPGDEDKVVLGKLHGSGVVRASCLMSVEASLSL